MIKIGHLYIHFTFLFLVLVCYFNRNLEIMLLSYSVIFFHELAHLAAAKIIGLKASHITLFPFGVNLKLKNSLVYGIADEILLYLSGPLFNIIMALISIPMIDKGRYWELFYINNLSLFIFNILPIVPMDGGIVLKKIISRGVGYRRSEILLKTISVFLIIVIMVFEINLLIKNNFNFSILLVSVFLIGNIFTNKEKYHIDFTKELMFYKKKDRKEIKKVKGYLIKENASYKELAKNFSVGSHYVVFKENSQGRINQILTEREIIEEILT